jgi:hypothetical protein
MEQSLFDEIYAKLLNAKDAEKKEIYANEISQLSSEEKLDFFHKYNLEKKLSQGFKDEYICKDDQKGQICLLEFSNICRDFDIQVSFLLMNAFLHDRMKTIQFESDEQKLGAEFLLQKLFGSQENIMDALNVVIKDNDASNPAYIPNVNSTIKLKSGKIIPMPTFTQYRNAYNYCNTHYDEGRILAKNIFGTIPTCELSFKIHGVFKDMDEANIYRIKNSAKISHLYPAELGKTILADNYRSNLTGIILYNPSDPDLEIMLQGKHNIMRAEAKLMKERSRKITKDERIPKESMEKIRNFKRAKSDAIKKINKLKHNNALENDILDIEAEVTKHEQDINKEVAKFTRDEESIIRGFKVKKGKIASKADYIM